MTRLVLEHRRRAINPERPVLRGRRRTPTCFFRRGRRSIRIIPTCPDIVQEAMDRFAKIVGRPYHLFDYFGAPDAERVIV